MRWIQGCEKVPIVALVYLFIKSHEYKPIKCRLTCARWLYILFIVTRTVSKDTLIEESLRVVHNHEPHITVSTGSACDEAFSFSK